MVVTLLFWSAWLLRSKSLSPHSVLLVRQLGVYDEGGLQRLDLILAEAASHGIRVIFPLVNVWPDLGGMQWWVDQVSSVPVGQAWWCH